MDATLEVDLGDGVVRGFVFAEDELDDLPVGAIKARLISELGLPLAPADVRLLVGAAELDDGWTGDDFGLQDGTRLVALPARGGQVLARLVPSELPDPPPVASQRSQRGAANVALFGRASSESVDSPAAAAAREPSAGEFDWAARDDDSPPPKSPRRSLSVRWRRPSPSFLPSSSSHAGLGRGGPLASAVWPASLFLLLLLAPRSGPARARRAPPRRLGGASGARCTANLPPLSSLSLFRLSHAATHPSLCLASHSSTLSPADRLPCATARSAPLPPFPPRALSARRASW